MVGCLVTCVNCEYIQDSVTCVNREYILDSVTLCYTGVSIPSELGLYVIQFCSHG